jgi:Fic family protein
MPYKPGKKKTLRAKEPKKGYSKPELWNKAYKLYDKFEKSGLSQTVNFEEFNRIAIVHHSSAIEGSTLTLEETTLLLTEGITAKGKHISEHEMVKDHYNALLFVLENTKSETKITPDFLKRINRDYALGF